MNTKGYNSVIIGYYKKDTLEDGKESRRIDSYVGVMGDMVLISNDTDLYTMKDGLYLFEHLTTFSIPKRPTKTMSLVRPIVCLSEDRSLDQEYIHDLLKKVYLDPTKFEKKEDSAIDLSFETSNSYFSVYLMRVFMSEFTFFKSYLDNRGMVDSNCSMVYQSMHRWMRALEESYEWVPRDDHSKKATRSFFNILYVKLAMKEITLLDIMEKFIDHYTIHGSNDPTTGSFMDEFDPRYDRFVPMYPFVNLDAHPFVEMVSVDDYTVKITINSKETLDKYRPYFEEGIRIYYTEDDSINHFILYYKFPATYEDEFENILKNVDFSKLRVGYVDRVEHRGHITLNPSFGIIVEIPEEDTIFRYIMERAQYSCYRVPDRGSTMYSPGSVMYFPLERFEVYPGRNLNVNFVDAPRTSEYMGIYKGDLHDLYLVHFPRLGCSGYFTGYDIRTKLGICINANIQTRNIREFDEGDPTILFRMYKEPYNTSLYNFINLSDSDEKDDA